MLSPRRFGLLLLLVSTRALASPSTPLDPFLFLNDQWVGVPDGEQQGPCETRSSRASYEWAIGGGYILGKHQTYCTVVVHGGSETTVEEYWNFLTFDEARKRLILRQLGRSRDVRYLLDGGQSSTTKYVFVSDTSDCYFCAGSGQRMRYTLEAIAPGGFTETLEYMGNDERFAVSTRRRFTRAPATPIPAPR